MFQWLKQKFTSTSFIPGLSAGQLILLAAVLIITPAVLLTRNNNSGPTPGPQPNLDIQPSTDDQTPPAAVIASPKDGQTVKGVITLTAKATDNVGVVGVQFMMDGKNVGEQLTDAPYQKQLDTTKISNGSHSLSAVASDAAGNTSRSDKISILVENDLQTSATKISSLGHLSDHSITGPTVAADTTAPSVTLTSPADGTLVSGSLVLKATASDDRGVAGMQFKLDGANLGSEDTSPPYSFDWDSTAATDGVHHLSAVASDAAGNIATSTVSVTVDNSAPAVPAGVVASGQTTSSIMLNWDASSDGAGAGTAGYNIYRDGLLIASTSLTSYTDGGLADATSYAYAIAAFDSLTNTSATSVPLTATTLDGTAPTAPGSLTNDLDSMIAITVSWPAATDNVAVSGYNLYQDGSLIGSTTDLSYDFTGLACGQSYTLAVEAYDAAGNKSAKSQLTQATQACPTAPDNPVLDDFNRADATTPGSSWSHVSSSGTYFHIDTQSAVPGTSFQANAAYRSSSWRAPATANQEAFVTIEGFPPQGAYGVFVRQSGNSGYAGVWNANGNKWIIYRIDGDSSSFFTNTVTLGTATAPVPNVGDKIWLTAIGDQLTLYYGNSVDGTWTPVVQVTDSTYVGSGNIGLWWSNTGSTTAARVDDFGGGDLATTTYGSILDDFNRPDENPISSTNWSKLSGSIPHDGGSYTMQVKSNEIYNAGGGTNTGMAVWNTPFAGDQEAHFRTSVTNSSYNFWVMLNMNSTSGYMLKVSGGNWYIYRLDGGVATLLASASGQLATNQDTLIGRHVGSQLTFSVIHNGVETAMVTADDSTYSGGQIGVMVSGSQRVDDFGGGSLSP